MTGSPCYGCQVRTDRCHSDCELYISWLITHAEEKKREQENNKHYQDMYVVKEESFRRRNRK